MYSVLIVSLKRSRNLQTRLILAFFHARGQRGKNEEVSLSEFLDVLLWVSGVRVDLPQNHLVRCGGVLTEQERFA